MSLVGPRPHPVDDVNQYELHHYRRLDVKPGITGLWQITARDCPSFDLNMHLDLTYIENSEPASGPSNSVQHGASAFRAGGGVIRP